MPKRLRMVDVQIKCGGVNDSTIYRWIQTNHFPKPIRLSHRVALWDESAIEAWIKARYNEESSSESSVLRPTAVSQTA